MANIRESWDSLSLTLEHEDIIRNQGILGDNNLKVHLHTLVFILPFILQLERLF